MKKENILRLQTIVFMLSLVTLSECGQTTPLTPTIALTTTTTTAPTASLTSTVTPIPTNTNTPKLTPTKETKQFEQISIEDCLGYFISEQDLSNGDYYRWLSTSMSQLFENPPDFSKFAVYGGGGMIHYQGINGGPIGDPKTAPVHRGVTCGYTETQEVNDGTRYLYRYVVLPVEFAVPNKPNETKWVIFLAYLGYRYSKTEEYHTSQTDEFYKDLIKGFIRPSIGIAIAGYVIESGTHAVFKESAIRFPDLTARIENFRYTLDPTYISEPGLILETVLFK